MEVRNWNGEKEQFLRSFDINVEMWMQQIHSKNGKLQNCSAVIPYSMFFYLRLRRMKL